MRVWNGLKLSISISMIVGLVFSSAFFAVLLYAKMTDQDLAILAPKGEVLAAGAESDKKSPAKDDPKQTVALIKNSARPEVAAPAKKPSAFISAPAIKQHPELPAGCEVTSLTMLLQFYGVNKDKMQLAQEMKRDTTPISLGADGSIEYWGNPHTGFVGDVTRKQIGFGIYHSGLFALLEKYVPTAVDLTGGSFQQLEAQVSQGIPVVVWTTINFKEPAKWVKWNTPIGPIKTTFSEHAVLLVGYDQDFVYVNDPKNGHKNVKLPKSQFLKTWDMMGKQAISYKKIEKG